MLLLCALTAFALSFRRAAVSNVRNQSLALCFTAAAGWQPLFIGTYSLTLLRCPWCLYIADICLGIPISDQDAVVYCIGTLYTPQQSPAVPRDWHVVGAKRSAAGMSMSLECHNLQPGIPARLGCRSLGGVIPIVEGAPVFCIKVRYTTVALSCTLEYLPSLTRSAIKVISAPVLTQAYISLV